MKTRAAAPQNYPICGLIKIKLLQLLILYNNCKLWFCWVSQMHEKKRKINLKSCSAKILLGAGLQDISMLDKQDSPCINNISSSFRTASHFISGLLRHIVTPPQRRCYSQLPTLPLRAKFCFWNNPRSLTQSKQSSSIKRFNYGCMKIIQFQ